MLNSAAGDQKNQDDNNTKGDQAAGKNIATTPCVKFDAGEAGAILK